MPSYTFLCAGCEARKEVLASSALANQLELICTACGGNMRCAPVLRLTRIGPATETRRAARAKKEESLFKACGHRYQCRCGVRLTRENPFRPEIIDAAGLAEEG